ncbi:hypothetical protein EV193_105313 [Herbihabitans rhizosphaerae]|uniref:Uncharacterized protein n=1 Tax=Herbihabitans rhizosphaerae TaxID=1872711 RepID=A0A4Q7KMI1_9PSEU|nr:hypothetical protein [Herbihabitans rhizosphaerae]RZS37755.1 hypothetical protein EV193_105313 [Herbihabitans rhizosphaerae]
MRIRTGLVIGLLAALTGCGTTGGTANDATTAAPASDKGDGIKFARCMRDQGINMPDPTSGGDREFSVSLPDGVDPDKADAATKNCKQYMPNGGEPRKLDPQTVEQMRKMARCMRDNGVPDFPDPKPDGGPQVERNGNGSNSNGSGGVDPEDPKFQAAERVCAQFRPTGAAGPHLSPRDPK